MIIYETCPVCGKSSPENETYINRLGNIKCPRCRKSTPKFLWSQALDIEDWISNVNEWATNREQNANR